MEARSIDLDGPAFYVEHPGPVGGPTFVLVHGLGGSYVNWMGVAEDLARHGRVLAPDLIGFGRTPLKGRSAGLASNQAFLGRFIEEVAGEPVVLVGNSMGGTLGIMQAAERPESVAGLVLVGPALPRTLGQAVDRTVATLFAAYMAPRLGESLINRRIRKLGPERVVEETLRLCLADASRVRPELLEAHVALARERTEMPWATPAFLEAARSLVRVLARRKRFSALLGGITAPGLVLAGKLDRLVPLAVAESVMRIRPDWDFVVFDDLGHAPQMEDPRAFVGAVDAWLSGPASRLLTGRRSLWGEAQAANGSLRLPRPS